MPGPSIPAAGPDEGRSISLQEPIITSPAVSSRSLPPLVEASSSESLPHIERQEEGNGSSVVSRTLPTLLLKTDPLSPPRLSESPIATPNPVEEGGQPTTSRLSQSSFPRGEPPTPIDIVPAAALAASPPNSPHPAPRRSGNETSRGHGTGVHVPDIDDEPPHVIMPSDGPRGTIRQRTRRFFSAQGRQERKEAGIVFRLASGLVQIALITTILSLSATKLTSPTNPAKKQWDSCSRPLGAWSALWAARIVLGMFMGCWEFFKEREKLHRQSRAPQARGNGDIESGGRRTSTASTGSAALERQRRVTAQNRRSTASGRSAIAGPSRGASVSTSIGSPQIAASGAFAAGGLTSSPTTVPPRPSSAVVVDRTQRPRRASEPILPQSEQTNSEVDAPPRSQRRQRTRQPTQAEASTPPSPQPVWLNDVLFGRMETLLTMTALSHFVANQIFLYSSVNSCRVDAPHIWWLAFGIACLGYMVVLEIVLIAVVVFVIGPLLLLTLNLIMLCLGRPLDTRGNIQIRAEIPKLDQKFVDQIPLVVFIPEAKPEDETPAEKENEDNHGQDHSYPPRQGTSSSPSSSSRPGPSTPGTLSGSAAKADKSKVSRFLFLKRKDKTTSSQGSSSDAKKKASNLPTSQGGRNDATEDAWEAQFERGDYPFVKLEGNRATCAICLCDFVEPRRRDGTLGDSDNGGPSGVAQTSTSQDGTKGAERTEDATKAKGSKAQEQADDDQGGSVAGEPLRLLGCGHVFHKQCLDPWLLDVSGRCPTCQRKVVDEPTTK